eukprot:SAG11_NODE_1600_length_4608_cov_3.690397_2_plen_119_part_00
MTNATHPVTYTCKPRPGQETQGYWEPIGGLALACAVSAPAPPPSKLGQTAVIVSSAVGGVMVLSGLAAWLKIAKKKKAGSKASSKAGASALETSLLELQQPDNEDNDSGFVPSDNDKL